jgi:uncharacterized Tic20 family protein
MHNAPISSTNPLTGPAAPPPPAPPRQSGWGQPNGTSWTFPPPPVRSTNLPAVLAHLGPIFGGPIIPFVVYLTSRDDPFARRHATEALNWQLTVMLACFLDSLLAFAALVLPMAFLDPHSAAVGAGPVVVAFAVFVVAQVSVMVLAVVNLVLSIKAMVVASRHEDYRYPMTIQFLRP